VAPVELVRITHDEIRAGLWRRDRRLAAPTPEAPITREGDDPLGTMLVDRGWVAPPHTPPRP